MARSIIPVETRFMEKVRKDPRGCWIWTGCQRSTGYGSITVRGRVESAHRFSWSISHGPIPSGALVLHRCDVRLCVNPDHLFLGTPQDNSSDMVHKNRTCKSRSGLPFGVKRSISERNPFQAIVWAGKRQNYLGAFPTVELAAAAADKFRSQRRNAALAELDAAEGKVTG